MKKSQIVSVALFGGFLAIAAIAITVSRVREMLLWGEAIADIEAMYFDTESDRAFASIRPLKDSDLDA